MGARVARNPRRLAGRIALVLILAAVASVAQVPRARRAYASWSTSTWSSGQSSTGDFFGVAADGSSTIAVGDDSSGNYSQISSADASHTFTMETAYTGNGVDLVATGGTTGTNPLESISCTGTAPNFLCVAVGASGEAYTYSASLGKWAATSSTGASTDTLVGVSCVSTSFCIAVDSAGYAYQYNGSSWSGWTGAAWGSSGFATVDAKGLVGLSCDATNFCVAVDGSSSATYYNGTSWSAPRSIDSSGGSLTAISCYLSSFCVGTDNAGYTVDCTSGANCTALTFSVQQSAGSPLSSQGLTAVSCATSTYCLAVDSAGNAYVWGTSWSAAANIDSTTALDAISCYTTTYCAAADASGYVLTCTSGATCSTAGNWTSVRVDTAAALNGIACASTTLCTAVDAHGSGLAMSTQSWRRFAVDTVGLNAVSCQNASACVAVDTKGKYATWNGSAFSAMTASGDSNDLSAVSCPSTTFCATVDTAGNFLYATTDQPSSTWSGNFGIASANYPVNYTVSCQSSTLCEAGQNGDDISSSNAPTNSAKWKGAFVSGVYHNVDGSSCPATNFCTLVDSGGEYIYSTNPTNNRPTWNVATIDTKAGMSAVSCTSSTFCLAVDSGGNTVTCTATCSTSTNWSVSTGVDGTTSMSGVSCTSTSDCWAVDDLGNVLSTTNGGSTWTEVNVAGSDALTGISCNGTTNCVATDNAGYAYVFNSTGSAVWSGPVDLAPAPIVLDAISCTSSSFCMAVGSSGEFSTFNGTSWTTPATALPAETNTLTGVSCLASGECVAVDAQDNELVTTNQGSSWVEETAIFTQPLYSISCYGSTVCLDGATSGEIVAVTGPGAGETVASTFETPYNTFDGTSCTSTGTLCEMVDSGGYYAWSTAPTSAWNVNIDLDGSTGLNAISCASTSFCVAVDAAGNALTCTTTALCQGGTAWTKTSVTSLALTSVSCPTTSYCAAVDAGGNAYSSTNGTTWSAAPGNPVDGAPLTSTSCASATFCGATDSSGGLMTTNSSSAATVGPLNSVACPQTGSCVAVGFNGSVTAATILHSTNPTKATSWSAVPAANMPSGIYDLFSVTCPTNLDCYAVGQTTGGGPVLIYSTDGGQTWPGSATITSSLSGATLTSLYGVGCVPGSSTECWAVGRGNVTGVGSSLGLFVFGGGSSWTVTQSTASAAILSGIACTNAAPSSDPQCVVSGDYGNSTVLYVATGASASTASYTKVSTSVYAGTQYLYGVACSTADCFAYGWDGSGGLVLKQPLSSLSASPWSTASLPAGSNAWWAMECPSATCTVGGSGSTDAVADYGP